MNKPLMKKPLMKKPMSKFLFCLGLPFVLTLNACAAGGLGEAISNTAGSINPFNRGNTNASQGEVAGDESRVSILSLDESLVVSGAIRPEDIILPDPYVNTDWPQTGGNTFHTVQHTQTDGSLDRLWSKDVGAGSGRKSRILATPVISSGRLFVMDGDNRVKAFDAQTGAPIWSHKIKLTKRERTRTGRRSFVERFKDPLAVLDRDPITDQEGIGGGVAIDGNVVYATSGLGIIVALDRESGTLLWDKEVRAPMHSSPTISNGRVFAVTDDNELFAFDTENGEVLWTYQGISETARMLTSPAPAVIDDVVVAPFASGELIAFQVQNGTILWQDALSSAGRLTPLSSLNDIASGPVISDGYVIASAQSGVTSAFDLRTGQRIWAQPAGSIGFPTVVGDFIYLVTTNSELVCMSKTNGTVVWVEQLPQFKKDKKKKGRISWAGPILTGNKLFVASSEGEYYEVNPYNGGIESEGKIGGAVYVPPVIANQTVYVLTDKAKLVALQ